MPASRTACPPFAVAGLALAALAAACEAERIPPELAAPGGPDLSIALVYVTQSTQRQAFDVPLVAGKDAVVRVWVAATGPATAPPLVRVRVYDGGTLVDSIAVDPPGPVVPAGVDESTLAGSWNAVLPGALIQPGRSLLVDVDSDRRIVETDESNNDWPAGGAPRALLVTALQPLRVRVWSVRTADGRTGAASTATLEYFTGLTRRLWPVAALDQDYGGVFTSTGTPASDGSGWETVLSELEAKRQADGFDGHYYGAVATAYGSGVAGLGYVGGYGAVGWDKVTAGQPAWSSSAVVLAHEIGHNFGLQHAPGCGATGTDPAYPYADAVTGVWGLDVERDELKAPTAHDVMAYCSDVWVSDYNYEKVLAALDARAGLVTAAGAPPEALLVWGRVEGSVRVLEPPFALPVAPRPPPPGGERLTGLDVRGAVLFSVPFALAAVGCGAETSAAAFAFTVPLAGADTARLAELRWESEAGVTVRREVPRLPASAATAPAPSAVRLPDGAARVRWDAGQADVVLFRDRASGTVLGFGRGGVADVAGAGAEVEVRLPAGGGPARVHRIGVGQ